MAGDSFSEWHRCKRWTDRGLDCPFDPLEEGGDDPQRTTEDPEIGSGLVALQKAVGSELGTTGLGQAEFLGPLLALFTILRAVQTMGPGLKMGRVHAAGFAEEATVRVLRPEVPAREGPTPAKPTPAKAPVGHGRGATPRSGGGGGFFVNQAAELKQLLGRR